MADVPSFVVYDGNGVQTDFVFPFSYLDASHISVTVGGAARTFQLISQNTVRVTPAPVVGSDNVRIFRKTPGEAIVVWHDAATILGKDLNTSSTQPRLVAEEARDIATEAKEQALANVADALQAVVDAQAAATLANTSKVAAAASQTAAATSASTATTKAAEATTGANTATTKAGEASASASTATTKASEAAASASTATTKASEAATSASTATTKASEAATSATTATTKAGEASASATAAANSAASALSLQSAIEGIYDAFDDRYLGMKPSDPTVDNDGNALQIGSLYFNTTDQQLRIRTASGWFAAYIPSTNAVNSFNGRTGTVVPATGDYAVAQVTGLQTALDGKAASSHAHAIGDITNLQTTLNGKAPANVGQGKHTIWVPATAMHKNNGAAGPSLGQFVAGATNVNYLAFDPATLEDAFFPVAMPKSWDLGPITAQFYWFHSATTTNFNVVWQVFAEAYSDGNLLDGLAYGGAGTIDTGGTTNALNISAETGPITIGNTPAAGDFVHLIVRRPGNDASDTLAVDAFLLGVKIFYTTNAATDA
jgi:hypothetical protein